MSNLLLISATNVPMLVNSARRAAPSSGLGRDPRLLPSSTAESQHLTFKEGVSTAAVPAKSFPIFKGPSVTVDVCSSVYLLRCCVPSQAEIPMGSLVEVDVCICSSIMIKAMSSIMSKFKMCGSVD